MRRIQTPAVLVLQQSCQQTRFGRVDAIAVALSVLGELGLHRVPNFLGQDRLMLARVDHTLVRDPTDIHRVGQQSIQMTASE